MSFDRVVLLVGWGLLPGNYISIPFTSMGIMQILINYFFLKKVKKVIPMLVTECISDWPGSVNDLIWMPQ